MNSATSTPASPWWHKKPSTFVKLSSTDDSSAALSKITQPLKPNFSNQYEYNQPITRTPADKQSWNEKFRPVKVSPLYQSEIDSGENKGTDSLLIDDIVPKSSIVNQQQVKTSLGLGETTQKDVDLPKWPYVETLWNKVDKIMGDLLEPEDEKANNISNIDNILSSLNLDTSEKNKIENDALYSSLNKKLDVNPTSARPDQEYWQNLKNKNGFISAFTDYYQSTTKKPAFYHHDLISSDSNEFLVETTLERQTESSNSLYFDANQPPSEPHINNQNILVAKRNISTSNDVLVYLNEIIDMKNSNERTVKESASERGTTMKTLFSPDFHLFKEIDQVQDSLGNNKNFSHLNKFQLNFDYYQPSE